MRDREPIVMPFRKDSKRISVVDDDSAKEETSDKEASTITLTESEICNSLIGSVSMITME